MEPSTPMEEQTANTRRRRLLPASARSVRIRRVPFTMRVLLPECGPPSCESDRCTIGCSAGP